MASRKTYTPKALLCSCGEEVRDKERSTANWDVYPNPAVCKKCSKDNSEVVKEHMMASLLVRRK